MVGFYNKRGTAEQWIKEGKQAVKPVAQTLLLRSAAVPEGGCFITSRGPEDPASALRVLWLSVLAYNLGNLWRRLVPPKSK